MESLSIGRGVDLIFIANAKGKVGRRIKVPIKFSGLKEKGPLRSLLTTFLDP